MAYALAIIRYRKPFEEIEPLLEAHRAYLRSLKEQGTLLVSGPLDPRNGGALLLRFVDEQNIPAALDRVRDGDPYIKAGVVQYELLRWNPVMGKESLDALP